MANAYSVIQSCRSVGTVVWQYYGPFGKWMGESVILHSDETSTRVLLSYQCYNAAVRSGSHVNSNVLYVRVSDKILLLKCPVWRAFDQYSLLLITAPGKIRACLLIFRICTQEPDGTSWSLNSCARRGLLILIAISLHQEPIRI